MRRYVRDAGAELERLHILTRADVTTRNAKKAGRLARAYDDIERRIAELSAQEELDAMRPELDGNRIQEVLGIRPGREVGEAYRFLLDLRLDEGIVGEPEAERRLREWWARARLTALGVIRREFRSGYESFTGLLSRRRPTKIARWAAPSRRGRLVHSRGSTMSLHHSTRGRLGLAIGAFGASALLLAGCAGGGGGNSTDGGDASGEPLIVGTTDKVTTLDPAGSYDNGSLAVQTQVFPYLVNTDFNSNEVVPDLAETAEFTSPTEYTVTLPAGLKWANGNDLTSADVKFSFDRNIAIADPNGASSLLYNLDSVEAPDDTTVVFNMKAENDQIFPFILTSFPGAIVDDEVFAADALTPDQEIVDANAFGGPYAITS